MKRSPWQLSEAEAAAREDAILDQFLKARREADAVSVTPEAASARLERQFGHVAVRFALLSAINRRAAAAQVTQHQE